MADPADPDDEDWLRARERGDDVSHVSPQARARYDQLGQLIAALPERPPPAGWKQRVLDALDAPSPRSSSDALATLPAVRRSADDIPVPRSSSDALEQPPAIASPRSSSPALDPQPAIPPAAADTPSTRSSSPALGPQPSRLSRTPIVRGWRAWLLAGGAAAIGVVVLSLIVLPRPQPLRSEPVVTTEIRHGQSPRRGNDASVGDTLVVRTQSDQPFDLRIYGGGGEPLARCTDAQGCSVERTGPQPRYTLDLPLRSHGDVSAVLFIGGTMPEPKDLDADLAAAHNADIDARHVVSVHVQ